VLDFLGPGSRILGVVVIPTRADLTKALPEYGSGSWVEHDGPTWIVRAQGHFEPISRLGGGWFRPGLSDGFVIYDDATGKRLGWGFGRSTSAG
jgi:hypothetical protein